MTMNKFIFPLRLKVLITVLAFLMMVVGFITATMADLFHQDKTAYVRDLSASVTSDIKNEVDTILGGYVSATRVLSEVLFADYIEPEAKQRLVKPLFVAYPEILALVTTGRHDEPISIYNASAVRAAGIDPDGLLDFASAQPAESADSIGVYSVKLRSGKHAVVLTLEHHLSAEGGTRTISAIATPGLFRRAIERADAFQAVLIDARSNPVIGTVDADTDVRWATATLKKFENLEDSASGVINIWDDDVEYFAGAAKIDVGGLHVVTRISVSAAYLTARQLLSDLVIIGLIIVFIAAISAVVVSRKFTAPLESLSAAVRKIAKGDFDVKVDIKSRDEIGQLADSFNNMANELLERERSLKSAQLALVQSEKMAAVGTLSAGLAHEVKNPLSAVLGYAQLAKRKLSQPDVIKKHLDIIENETRRCNEIIGNLMQFSRQEKGEFTDVTINEVVEKSVGIVDHQLGLKNVHVNMKLAPDIPEIIGNSNQLQQVLMNLAINAQQAMEPDGGTVDIATYFDNDNVYISVSDTGPGISEEVVEKIFEPFFTTKAAGEGTGLGLSVTYGIIRDHKGDIRVEKADSGGARFVIALPLHITREPGSTGSLSLEKAS
ncbi:MAG: HAMP domain-containing protein [Proteobacteria bacterium]|nr:HAMP domain-containing protein [Pseudomonadota bacterium]